jgi:glycosyltransferase involved in cell wall biosynthesis
LQEPGVEHALDSMNPATWFLVARRLRQLRIEWLILPWWVSFWAPQYWTLARLHRYHGACTLLICHNVEEHESSGIRRFASRAVFRAAHRFLVHSCDDADNLRRMVPGARVTTAFLPSLSGLAGAAPDRTEARRMLGLGPGGAVLLFFGFVRPYKGLRHLLDAMPGILTRHSVRLLVAGEFWHDRPAYLEQIKRLGITDQVILLDRYVPNEEVARLFAAADLVVQPYDAATQSGVTQLAFSLGRPVLVTSVGGLPESVDHGTTGYVVPPGDASAIAAAVDDFLSRDRGPAMEAQIINQQQRFSWDGYIARLEEALR